MQIVMILTVLIILANTASTLEPVSLTRLYRMLTTLGKIDHIKELSSVLISIGVLNTVAVMCIYANS
jgi:hypothetical protein